MPVSLLQTSYEFPCKNYTDVVHATAHGSRDAIHYVYSTKGVPSLLVAHTSADNKLLLNCSRLHSGNDSAESDSIRFSHPVDKVMVLVYTRVCWSHC